MSKPGVFETTKYFVLLALAKEAAHGYALTGQMIADSVGGIYLRPSTLYATLQALEKAGLTERVGRWAAGETGEANARKVYRLTTLGQRRLADQARMHERGAQLAKARLGLRY